VEEKAGLAWDRCGPKHRKYEDPWVFPRHEENKRKAKGFGARAEEALI
jgi:hypothetical protein